MRRCKASQGIASLNQTLCEQFLACCGQMRDDLVERLVECRKFLLCQAAKYLLVAVVYQAHGLAPERTPVSRECQDNAPAICLAG